LNVAYRRKNNFIEAQFLIVIVASE